MIKNKIIKAVRIKNKVTQKQLAELLGMHLNNYSRYERGVYAFPDCLFTDILYRFNIPGDQAYNIYVQDATK